MKRSARPFPAVRRAGFTLVEAMMAMTIAVLVLGLTLSTFLTSLRAMYKDAQRLATNTALRGFTSQVAKETLDSTEFYVFPSYTMLDGNINLTVDYSDPVDVDGAGASTINLFHGDCLVLVTRVSTAADAAIRQFRIYYRLPTSTAGALTPTNPANLGPIRYYNKFFGDASTEKDLKPLLDAVPLATTPKIAGSREIVQNTRGRVKADGSGCYPIFSTESPTVTPTNDSVSINVEIITGKNAATMLSSSSFNYTISPRR